MPQQMRSLLSRLLALAPPETAHAIALAAMERLGGPAAPLADPVLETRLAGLAFPSPVGLAAGFDKDALVWRRMLAAGFGFVEVGTLTPRPQAGNPRPRVFRLRSERAVINRLGFNNGGIAAALPRLAPHPCLGINVGANKDSPDRIADYAQAVAAVRDVAAWITLNISSPNTPGLRGLQGEALPDLLAAAGEARGGDGPPLFLKVAPDLDAAQIRYIADKALEGPIAALVIGNTTVSRPEGLRGRAGREPGGLSGQPLFHLSTRVLRAFAERLGRRLPLVGVGGIASAEQAYAKIRAGASAVQLYTGLVYAGVGLPARLNAGLADLLKRDGFSSVAEAVGVDVKTP